MAKKQRATPLPVYKQAILRMCQLQLRICSKLMEMHRSKQPETLKHAARRTILGANSHDQSHRVIDALVDILPKDLLTFLHLGIPPPWEREYFY